MKKIIILLTLFAFISTAEAAVYKGQKLYVKKCRKCHGGGQDMAVAKKKKEWKKLLKSKGKGLSTLHLKNSKAKRSWKYFKSKKYSKRAKHLKDFLVEYAKDSGNVPACN
jgi:mono/diheme cytochrome c family protein